MRILITRLSHIGDAVLTMPLATRLRQIHPDWQIAWAAEAPAGQLLRLHPAIDQIIPIPKGWARQPSSWRKLRRRLQEYSPEVVLDPQSLLKSSLLGWLSGAPRRIGFAGRHGREGSTWFNNERVLPRSEHLVDRTLELLLPLGIEAGPVEFGLPVHSQSLMEMRNWLETMSLRDFGLLNPGAGWKSKQWLPDRFAQLASKIHQTHRLPSLVVWAGDDELKMAEQVVAQSEGSAILAPRTSLLQLAALCSLARLFVGGDTGPIHIASAMGCVCIGLYGTTRPKESGVYGSNHMWIQKWYQAGSNRQRRSAPNFALSDISVEDVASAANHCLLKSRQIHAA